MFKIDNGTATGTLPAPTAAGPNPNGFFTDGDAANAIPATVVNAEWLNMVQEEIAGTITSSGLTLDKSDRTQLRQAITAMISGASKAVVIKSATFAAGVADGEVVRWDSVNSNFAQAIADGTTSNNAVGVADVTNSEVICFGETRAGLMSGLTPGSRYYLDGTTAGALNLTAPTDKVRIGIAKAADIMFVDIDAESDAGGVLQAVKVFTASGTWTPDAGTTKIRVRLCGGGGGGGGGYADYYVGGGGGQGGRAEKLLDIIALGISSVAVTVGLGGTPGNPSDGGGAGMTNGGTGGTTSFGAYLSATGGGGGYRSGGGDDGWGGTGGLGSSGDINLRGAVGTQGLREVTTNSNQGGNGGGEGGGPGAWLAGTAGQDGVNGGGGGGGAMGAGGTAVAGAGGTGGPGFVIIEEYK